jgi:hypothetical protein
MYYVRFGFYRQNDVSDPANAQGDVKLSSRKASVDGGLGLGRPSTPSNTITSLIRREIILQCNRLIFAKALSMTSDGVDGGYSCGCSGVGKGVTGSG